MERFQRSPVAQAHPAVILVDTSIIVAWLDPDHEHHRACTDALERAAASDQLSVSSVTYGELAAGNRTQEAVLESLQGFATVDLLWEDAWRAGQAFGRFPKSKKDQPVLPDYFIRAQAAVRGWRHLTNDTRRLAPWADVDFIFARPRKV